MPASLAGETPVDDCLLLAASFCAGCSGGGQRQEAYRPERSKPAYTPSRTAEDPFTPSFGVSPPLLAPTTLIIMVITTIGSFKVFDHIYLMTGGGPENGTLVLAFYIYEQAFEFFNIGYASALAIIMFVIVMALTVVQILLRQKGAG